MSGRRDPGSGIVPPPLDELSVLVVVDNETDTLSSVDDGVPQVPEILSRIGRVEPTGSFHGDDCIPAFDDLCLACHGFSALVTGRLGAERRTVLFDVGPSADVWLDNAGRLGVDLAEIGTVFLSHWHADHSGGIPEVVAAISSARQHADRPPPVVDLHPDRPDQRGTRTPFGLIVMLGPEPTFEAIEESGGRIARHAEGHLVDGLFLSSGEIPRVTDYETGLPNHMSFRDGVGRDDPLILDERFLAARVSGRGVTVLSACSHAGVVNACLEARSLLPDEPIDLVIGGYHLAGAAMEGRIPETVRDLTELVDPRVVAPGHCTGWRAKAALAGAFAPGRYGPSVVGTTYHLTAPA